jgi:hypothetical protein
VNKPFTILVLIASALCYLQSGCKKSKLEDSDGLPPLTFEGKNTIGCKINGNPWVPMGIVNGAGVTHPTSGGYYETAFFRGVHILIETNSSDGYIEFFCRNYSGIGYLLPGRYLLNKNTGDIHFGTGQIHSYGYYHTNGKTYFTDSLRTGWIEILKSDSVNKIISGKFEFEAYNSLDAKTYRITDGRFDYRNH